MRYIFVLTIVMLGMLWGCGCSESVRLEFRNAETKAPLAGIKVFIQTVRAFADPLLPFKKKYHVITSQEGAVELSLPWKTGELKSITVLSPGRGDQEWFIGSSENISTILKPHVLIKPSQWVRSLQAGPNDGPYEARLIPLKDEALKQEK